jgi:hypothetical protein
VGFWPFIVNVASARTRWVPRAGERFSTDLLSTELGDVADISGHGMRVRAVGRVRASVGQVVPLTIRWADCRLSVKGRVVRVARTDDGAREVGVQFVDASPRVRAALAHLGQYGFVPGAGGGPEEYGARAGDAAQGGRPRKALPDHYKVLGVTAGASAAEIRDAYRRLSLQHHPDVSRDPEAARTFQALADAYRALRNDDARKRYDEARGRAVGASCN